MKLYTVLTVSVLLVLCSCRTPTQKQTADQTRVDKAQRALLTNEIQKAEAASEMVFATSVALDRDGGTNRSIYVAKSLNQRAMMTLGLPEYTRTLELREMVDQLLSENAKLRATGSNSLVAFDTKVGTLEKENAALQSKLDTAEQGAMDNYRKMAPAAEKWEKLVGWFHKILWIIGISVGLLVGVNIAAIAYPPLAPVAFILNKLTGGIFGGLGAIVFRLIPSAHSSAGVVKLADHEALEAKHEETQDALNHLVKAIERMKISDPKSYNESLKPHMLEVSADTVLRPVVDATKEKVGL